MIPELNLAGGLSPATRWVTRETRGAGVGVVIGTLVSYPVGVVLMARTGHTYLAWECVLGFAIAVAAAQSMLPRRKAR